jgi:uncharacterized protein (DUF305 family)
MLALGLSCSLLAAEPAANGHHPHVASAASGAASDSNRQYGAMVDGAMAAMHDGMAQAPMNGQADHDFASMMIPHHQGAVDMARAELLYGTNPVLRRLAQEIIITQGQEIDVMRMELQKPPAATPASH